MADNKEKIKLSPKLKKLILAAVIFLILGIIALIAVSLFSNATDITISDLRLVDVVSNKDIYSREVYLVSPEVDKFDVKVNSVSSALTYYTVYSSDNSVASISKNGNNFTVKYHKAGKTVITAKCTSGGNIEDKFTLTVRDNVPNKFVIINGDSDDEISVFADSKDYEFDFHTFLGDSDQITNNGSLEVVETYDKNTFDYVKIDSKSSKLIVKAKKSENTIKKYITIQSVSYFNDEKFVVKSFVITINVNGYYVSDLQLEVYNHPVFSNLSENIVGTGLIRENENRISNIYLTQDVNKVFVRVRAVWTNGDIFDITEDANCSSQGSQYAEVLPVESSYFEITAKAVTNVTFSYIQRTDKTVSLNLNYFSYNSIDNAFQEIIKDELYLTKSVSGITVFEYNYWDNRFIKRNSITTEIVDDSGEKIVVVIGFAGEE